jgi:hypothetical protein
MLVAPATREPQVILALRVTQAQAQLLEIPALLVIPDQQVLLVQQEILEMQGRQAIPAIQQHLRQ